MEASNANKHYRPNCLCAVRVNRFASETYLRVGIAVRRRYENKKKTLKTCLYPIIKTQKKHFLNISPTRHSQNR